MVAWNQQKRALATLIAFVVLLCGFQSNGLAQDGRPVELELLLAVDASSSVDDQEFALQRYGLAQAFRDPGVVAAIGASGKGIAVSLVQWSSGGRQAVAIDWVMVNDGASADRLADALVLMPRIFPGGDTSLRGIIHFASRQFAENGFAGQRQVVDISGDGGAIENRAAMPGPARDAAVALGITINGLAILNEVADLDHYYRKHVIGGPGAFVVAAAGYRDYAQAIKIKLIQEISARPLAGPGPQGPALVQAAGATYLEAHER